jgi:hypothetical protein
MARGMQWKAISQAAKKGYSHLSGCSVRSEVQNKESRRRWRYHGENVVNVHMIPPLVADILASSRRRRPNEIPFDPPLVNVMIILL